MEHVSFLYQCHSIYCTKRNKQHAVKNILELNYSETIIVLTVDVHNVTDIQSKPCYIILCIILDAWNLLEGSIRFIGRQPIYMQS